MSFTLLDLGAENFEFTANVWNWKAALEIIKDLDIISENHVRQLGYNAMGVKMDVEEAHLSPAFTRTPRAALPSLAEAGPAELKAFHLSGFIVALLSHGVISLLVGLLYAAILPMMPSRFTAFWGSFLAPVLWTALVASTLRLVNPALNARIAWGWFIASQVAFGLITGFIVAHSKEVETAQSWPLAARAGVEAPGLIPEQEEER